LQFILNITTLICDVLTGMTIKIFGHDDGGSRYLETTMLTYQTHVSSYPRRQHNLHQNDITDLYTEGEMWQLDYPTIEPRSPVGPSAVNALPCSDSVNHSPKAKINSAGGLACWTRESMVAPSSAMSCFRIHVYSGPLIYFYKRADSVRLIQGVYSGIKKIYYRKTVGHVFTKPVQIEGTTQNFFPIKLFFIVVHISAARRCECM
jgi:hypothetical protein